MPRPLPAGVLAATDGEPDAVRTLILDAARRVIDARGLAAASTRAIAEESGVGGGTLYNYFDNHIQLLAKAIVQSARNLTGPILDLPARTGRATVAANLAYFVRHAATVLDRLVPAMAAAFSDNDLLAAVRREIAEADPLNDPAKVVERYLLAERDLGRVSATADCRAAASLIVSLCHDDAFNRYLHGASARPKSRRKEIALVARSVSE
jgi:AcrR family transcriptional regulator